LRAAPQVAIVLNPRFGRNFDVRDVIAADETSDLADHVGALRVLLRPYRRPLLVVNFYAPVQGPPWLLLEDPAGVRRRALKAGGVPRRCGRLQRQDEPGRRQDPPFLPDARAGEKSSARAVRALAAALDAAASRPLHTLLHRNGSSRIDYVFTSRELHARWSFVTTLRWGRTRFDHRALSAQFPLYVDECCPPVPPWARRAVAALLLRLPCPPPLLTLDAWEEYKVRLAAVLHQAYALVKGFSFARRG
jgi:hypothetical protein